VREFCGAMDRGDAGVAAEFFAEDAINHGNRTGCVFLLEVLCGCGHVYGLPRLGDDVGWVSLGRLCRCPGEPEHDVHGRVLCFTDVL